MRSVSSCSRCRNRAENVRELGIVFDHEKYRVQRNNIGPAVCNAESREKAYISGSLEGHVQVLQRMPWIMT